MLKHYALCFSKSLFIVSLFIFMPPILGFAAVDFYSMGSLVTASPFDSKARDAGCFNIPLPAETSLPNKRSIESLFAVAKSFRYVPDRNGDRWQSAEETEVRHAGDCEDKAIWLFTRLLEQGYSEVRLVVGKYRSIDSQLHVWVVCTDNEGNAYILDPSKQKRMWSLNEIDAGFYRPLYAYDGQNCYRYPISQE